MDQFNHVMDAERYITVATKGVGISKKRGNIRAEKSKNTAFIPKDLERDKLLKRKRSIPREYFE